MLTVPTNDLRLPISLTKEGASVAAGRPATTLTRGISKRTAFGQLGHRRVGNVHVAGDAKVGEEDCAIRGEKEVAGLKVALLSADGASHVHDNAHAHAWDSHG